MLDAANPNPVMAPARDVIFLKNFIKNPNIEVGEYTYYHDFNHPELFESQNVLFPYLCKLTIGKFCQIAMGTKFILNSANHQMSGFSTYPFFIFGEAYRTYELDMPKKGDTVIGNDVWFGNSSVVMPGVTIGDGAIIGAHSVVTKDVAPYSIVGGNPARVIHKRFDDEIIEELVKIAWWNWDIEKITENVSAIVGADIEALRRA